MPARHRAAQPRRRKLQLIAGISLPVLLLVGIYLVHLGTSSQPPPSAAADTARTARSCASPAAAASARCAKIPAATPRTRPSGRPGSPLRRPKRSATPRTPQHSPSRAPAQSPRPPASPSRTPAPPVSQSAAQQVLALINQARAKAGLPAYTVTAGLNRSSAAHNQRMASGCGLSHQCPAEPSLGARETAAGVDWTAAGENIGEGGPEPDTSSAIAQMALTLTKDMLNERPPGDGHRLNILSSTFTHIGITVQQDSSGTVWMTQDFSN